jgi:TetR/AcrR family transcriptional regulator, transcriptional repressor of aconitase
VPRLTRAQQQERTRELLIEAAAQRFAERGYDGARAEDIAETAGFSKGAFYSNFKSKQDLAIAVLQRLMNAAQERLATAAQFDHGDEATLLTTLRETVIRNNDDPRVALVRLELLLRAARDADLRAVSTTLYQVQMDRREAVVTELFARLKRQPPAEPRVIVSAVFAALLGCQMLTFAGVRFASMREILDLLLNVLLRNAPRLEATASDQRSPPGAQRRKRQRRPG